MRGRKTKNITRKNTKHTLRNKRIYTYGNQYFGMYLTILFEYNFNIQNNMY